MKLSKNIYLQELVPKETYLKLGDGAAALISPKLPIILERIRELCGNKAMTLNDWHYGGRLSLRGYRPPECTTGAPKSMHKKGAAADFTIKGMTAEQVRVVILANQAELYALGLRRIESGTSWVHIDIKDTGVDHIVIFKP